MKKIILISIFLSIVLIINAQKFEGGLIGGMAASQIDGDRHAGFNKIGFEFGPYVNVFLKDWLAIQSGISYITKGSHSSSKQSYMNTHLDYIQVPVLLDFYFFKRINFTTGLTFAYLFRGFIDDGGSRTSQKDAGIINFNLCTYFSFNYKLGKNLTAKIAYNQGIIPNAGLSRASTFQWNRTVCLSLVYRIIKDK